MSQFKTAAEIYQALLDGKKIRYSSWPAKSYTHLADGVQVNEDGGAGGNAFRCPEDWSLYEEPKPKRTFYRRKWALYGNLLSTDQSWCTSKEEFDRIYTGSTEPSDEWETIEI